MSKNWTTYRRADGELIWGAYAFVADTEYFEEVDEPTEVIKETWLLQESEMITFGSES